MFAFNKVFTVIALFAWSALAAPIRIRSESHTVSFVNNCGSGTVGIQSFFSIHSSCISLTFNSGPCLLNGEECTTITLVNPTAPGAGSSVDVTLIAPHTFNVGAGFSYSDSSCGGQTCAGEGCTEAFYGPTDYSAQTQCETDNVGVTVTFC
ncbi:hypothetical protein BT96DRAFT_889122 [Gymnopus androsaceus JB14]|uniref:Glycopeptide n=1 Tax=Gymnopus androsaceus JB14 TaxID=1447944 RepID=A0A6A4GYA8_9AGAR|nr:hypothetical protein BT96DRAFT_889122 [Gymnopus androsaceus JB14]